MVPMYMAAQQQQQAANPAPTQTAPWVAPAMAGAASYMAPGTMQPWVPDRGQNQAGGPTSWGNLIRQVYGVNEGYGQGMSTERPDGPEGPRGQGRMRNPMALARSHGLRGQQMGGDRFGWGRAWNQQPIQPYGMPGGAALPSMTSMNGGPMMPPQAGMFPRMMPQQPMGPVTRPGMMPPGYNR